MTTTTKYDQIREYDTVDVSFRGATLRGVARWCREGQSVPGAALGRRTGLLQVQLHGDDARRAKALDPQAETGNGGPDSSSRGFVSVYVYPSTARRVVPLGVTALAGRGLS